MSLRLACGAVICVAAFPCVAQNRYSVSEELANGPGSPRVIVLRDNTAGIEAAVAPSEGGELSSFRVKVRGQWTELLYHARDYAPGPGFKGKGPLLWPAVGAQYPVGTIPETSCGEGPYLVAGKSYPMPCHGFARNLPWKDVSRSSDRNGAQVTVELRDSERTRPYYPFGFQLTATFEIVGGHLTVTYAVAASPRNAEPMIFSIGNHIAFNIPFLKGTNPADMLFETPSTVELLRNSRGVLSGEQRPRSFSKPLRLGDFNATVAMPLAGYQGQAYARLVDPQGLALRIAHHASSTLPEPLVQFNIFGGPDKGYFSPEPWFGLQNSLNLGKGLVTLQPGKTWNWKIELQADAGVISSPEVEKVAGGFGFVEGPVWAKDGFLLFSDIFKSRIMKLTGPGQAAIHRDRSNAANGNSMDTQGRLYSCERDGRRVVRMEKDGTLTVIAAQWDGHKLNSPNDVVVRRDGHIYFTDPASKAVTEPQELGFNGVFHVTPTGELSLITRSLKRPNGVALTPDGRTLYVADSERKKIFAFDLDSIGNASSQREFIPETDGSPDGLRVAENGNLYIACRGIAIYTPAGKFVRTIEFPEQPANCAFGDPDLRTLYVTARTSLYRVRVPDKGSQQY
jgi:gluconolactonase